MKRSLEKLRLEYGNEPLLEENLLSDPISQFEVWLQEAIQSGVVEPNGMVLATVSELGRPSTRTVLLKKIDHGFVFFTNLLSKKALQLQRHPFASLTFWWKEIFRQVNIEGVAKQVTFEESAHYFEMRPKGAQIAALASSQSSPLSTRLELEEKVAEIKKNYRSKPIPCPKDWGGFRIIPDRMEFWQGRKNRLHDRFQYVKVDKEWVISRLYP